MVDTEALLLTLRLSSLCALLLLVATVPLAAWLVLGRSGWRPVAEAIAMVPLVLPPTVLGYYLLVLLGPRTALGRALTHVLGHPLAFSFAGLLIGSLLYSLPFALQPLVAGFSQVPRELLEAAALLGAGRLRVVWSVLLPLSRRAILGSVLLAFAHTVGEFGVVLMIGGDIPGATRTLSISLLDSVQSFDYAAANRTATLLLVASVAGLTALYSLRQRRSRSW
ncbi:molybdate ABC transporter permease subunit [Acidipila sp. EB88]|uniref:molybdate ABC transporter permease subunit n=1 Tax=Acidipila sp. EB88 TaxID=2305226 RepID=UPI001F3AFFB1|nr:molybdate ABC transporter permease subunit [Acidipila sp. EB88]